MNNETYERLDKDLEKIRKAIPGYIQHRDVNDAKHVLLDILMHTLSITPLGIQGSKYLSISYPLDARSVTALVRVTDAEYKDAEAALNEYKENNISTYTVGEPVIYQNGDRFELGIVKSVCGSDEYFINYHTGDTAARTHARNLHKISNAYAFFIKRIHSDEEIQ